MAALASTGRDFGVVGMGTMGQNLALNVASRGLAVSAWNRADEFAARVWSALDRAKAEGAAAGVDMDIEGFTDLSLFVNSLKQPRRILLSIPAGQAVDQMLSMLIPLVSRGDVIVDGGNEEFGNTERRAKALLADHGLHFIGMGISGGEVGARHGPALMPGGTAEGYAAIKPVVEAMAARAPDGEPCVCHIGKGGSGHYVKMVHNGIEYADMQFIAEAYDILGKGCGLDPDGIAAAFENWNESRLKCYLFEITAKCLRKKDDLADGTGGHLIDRIVDQAGSKGTGKWTVQNAADAGVAVPAISAALEGRFISSRKAERGQLDALYRPLRKAAPLLDSAEALAILEPALYTAKVCAYAQGFALLATASADYGWGLDLRAIARLWRGGCIIRAALLDDIAAAFENDPALPNLLLDGKIALTISESEGGLRDAVCFAARARVAAPALSATLAYFDGATSARGPANVVQAQRDFFGAHTYKRDDKSGAFHCSTWETDAFSSGATSTDAH
ncbi:putative 6-phosphogluconate 1-dehydrogenase [Pelagophyceae sp. CCMP2097]|nr:putative 6-phosphogluconate 1-dehydrogenase [Pelagophyceae sp. CCMP2097]